MMKSNFDFRARVVAAALLVGVGGFAGAARAQTAATVPVVVQKVQSGPANAPLTYNAQVEAIDAVDIQARASGLLKEIRFSEGQRVKEGDLLFEIEPDQLSAAVMSAQAQVARTEATRNAARQSLSRARDLLSRRTISQATLDDAQAAFDVAAADVQSANAALNTAELNLSYAQIRSPINGTIGRSLATRGNLVGPGSGSLARVVQLDPIRVAFSIADSTLVDIRQKLAGGQKIDANKFHLSLSLANGTQFALPGRVQFIDNEVNQQTGTVAVRALFPNPDHILAPGQFVRLTIVDEEARKLPMVPMASVLQDRQGKFVFVLNDNNSVTRQAITTGARIDNRWAATSGLEGGETIVVEGLQRVSDGQQVNPREAEDTP
ncbi:efflux RND transporter periplasmic adaptor subunit [Mesorhizobium sp. B2-6-3]|nr:efflux RND transporter periplasmic adaptor subunit [Mesorhizobium sp. B3-1-1]TPJ68265.1 efflux RND transporter periplasmic adaptor subunit [Mesorhizobium sp. B2-6-7]TPJ86805.1 efflux RND transporter periplasmic adaptor subunit [Mesorhizobium sp. B2-6-3]TPK02403.1 efflux RND transporter periplasmic adaptor subunit [Mesorhizobium sp. B2-5-10]TPK09864.1 efflux RND transporter periplasmic adaptor subunit [Mesorhizobium sp. B2-5-11]TPK34703.1 efflux RND transporter periplasmic adaptor subunit [M